MKKLILFLALFIASNAYGISVVYPPGSGGTGSGDTVAPATHSADYVPQWNGVANSKTLVAGFPITNQGRALVAKTSTADMVTYLGASPPTLSSLGISNHDQLSVSATGIVTVNSTLKVSTIQAKDSSGISFLCSNGSQFMLGDGGGSCSITVPAASVTVNVLTPVVKARTASGLQLQDDGGNLGLKVSDGGYVGINTLSPQYPLSVSGNAGVTGNLYITGDVLNNSHGSRVIHCSGAASSVTGTTNETTLASWTIPAGAMGANGQLEVIAIFNVSYTGNNKVYRFNFGGTNYYERTKDNDTTIKIHVIVQNANNASSQIGFSKYTFWDHSPDVAISSSVNTNNAVTCSITGQLGVITDTVTLVSVMARINK